MDRSSSKDGYMGMRRWIVPVLVLSVPFAVLAMAVWAASESEEQHSHRECARLAARSELVRRHWQSLETDPQFRPIIDAISHDFLPSAKDAEWQVKVVSRSLSSSPEHSEFERGAFREVERGQDEVFGSSKGEMIRYVSAVRLKESCMACHRVLKGQPDKPHQVGDVIAFVSVQRGAAKQSK